MRRILERSSHRLDRLTPAYREILASSRNDIHLALQRKQQRRKLWSVAAGGQQLLQAQFGQQIMRRRRYHRRQLGAVDEPAATALCVKMDGGRIHCGHQIVRYRIIRGLGALRALGGRLKFVAVAGRLDRVAAAGAPANWEYWSSRANTPILERIQ